MGFPLARTFVFIAALYTWLPSLAVGIPGQGTWETTLQARDINGDKIIDAYYDTVQDITWLADARITKTLGLPDNGRMEWQPAMDFAANLQVYGVDGWRLYKTFPLNSKGKCTKVDVGYGIDCGYNVVPETSEMAYLYYVTLGNTGEHDVVGWGQPGSNTGPFKNLGSNHFWSETDYDVSKPRAWNFGSSKGKGGYQDLGTKFAPNGRHHVWVVHDGDISVLSTSMVSSVPEPATYRMMILGLIIVSLGFGLRRGSTGDAAMKRLGSV